MFQNGNGSNHIYGLIAQTKANALSSGSTTSNIPEGTNLYFTSARARSVINALAPVAYNDTTGQISTSGYTGTVSVRNGTDTGAISLKFKNGILTGVA